MTDNCKKIAIGLNTTHILLNKIVYLHIPVLQRLGKIIIHDWTLIDQSKLDCSYTSVALRNTPSIQTATVTLISCITCLYVPLPNTTHAPEDKESN